MAPPRYGGVAALMASAAGSIRAYRAGSRAAQAAAAAAPGVATERSSAPPPPMAGLVERCVYPVPPLDVEQWENRDGARINDGRYTAFKEAASKIVPKERIIDDPVRAFAYGTDASFYRLNPQVVVKVHNEQEVKEMILLARKHQTPVTFRAAGTSLSGQAITDSVMLKLSHTGKNFRNYEIKDGGKQITVEPGLIGGEVNRLLVAYRKKHGLEDQYKIGPDPSSIDSCMMGGIIANNSSGMCCGVAQNTYHTLADMRIVFVDGTVLDTADPASREAFLKSHAKLVEGVQNLARKVNSDPELVALIKKKFAIKCTTGYSINALVDHPIDDPIEIIKRLMIGSEGTLGFVSQATINTVPDFDHKASCFIMFPDVRSACQGAAFLRRGTKVDAVEMFDYASILQCQDNQELIDLVPGLTTCPDGSAALLIECRGKTDGDLQKNMDEVTKCLDGAKLPYLMDREANYPFHRDAKKTKVYWDVRKGLIPIVGAARETGTSMLIEDVACHVDKLGDMTLDLIDMFKRHGYADASCFGHALEGNLHLVFSQGFRTDAEVKQYSAMMQELCEIVAEKHGGSLKAEHGTGRNVAPFVEMEWGSKAYEYMWELKELFDPEYILNPGVILNHDMDVHEKNLKPSPPADSLVDRCIECGFCESNCPSRDLSLTPRQRITVYREINRLQALPVRSAEDESRLKEFREIFGYMGEQTCAADGMCQEKCPVKINTGELIKSVRSKQLQEARNATSAANFVANNFAPLAAAVPPLLNTVDFFHNVLGPKPLELISKSLNKVSGNLVPVWNPYMPKGAKPLPEPTPVQQPAAGLERKVVYLASCVTRMMGPANGDKTDKTVHEALLSVMAKAGYEVVYPKNLNSHCCGMMFNSRGFKETAAVKRMDLEEELMKASNGGKYPIVCDTSPCLSTIKSELQNPELTFALYDPVDFVSNFLLDKLEFEQKKESVAVHVPCSSKKMGTEATFMRIASKCAKEVTGTGIPCCGMAGDRGMRYPELTASSLQHLPDLKNTCSDGYSNSRTCESSLSNHSGVHFRGLIHLVDECTTPKAAKAAERLARRGRSPCVRHTAAGPPCERRSAPARRCAAAASRFSRVFSPVRSPTRLLRLLFWTSSEDSDADSSAT
eukprot:CAMPEP_0183793250 /NCGR_PEP_ID=MMETSP0803_2-20130417/3086_1 /TAXON_ID=195967 /ORGANISM="Crustomastix stigmata, Strain CCMP3273" /LENGTH=1128 /DNA_ID=CAMNT_0026037623 /DNA_START=16 /DNA_END=3400 /DNA_ORIENTATION=-